MLATSLNSRGDFRSEHLARGIDLYTNLHDAGARVRHTLAYDHPRTLHLSCPISDMKSARRLLGAAVSVRTQSVLYLVHGLSGLACRTVRSGKGVAYGEATACRVLPGTIGPNEAILTPPLVACSAIPIQKAVGTTGYKLRLRMCCRRCRKGTRLDQLAVGAHGGVQVCGVHGRWR